MDLLIPLIMVGFGKRFMTKPPKNINVLFGYRTTMSIKNKDTWVFAHRYFGRLWFICGLVLIPLSVIPLIFVINKGIVVIGHVGAIICAVQLVPLIGAVFPTEAALKKTFNCDGFRR